MFINVKFIDERRLDIEDIQTHFNTQLLLQDSSCGEEELSPLVHHPTCGLSKVNTNV